MQYPGLERQDSISHSFMRAIDKPNMSGPKLVIQNGANSVVGQVVLLPSFLATLFLSNWKSPHLRYHTSHTLRRFIASQKFLHETDLYIEFQATSVISQKIQGLNQHSYWGVYPDTPKTRNTFYAWVIYIRLCRPYCTLHLHSNGFQGQSLHCMILYSFGLLEQHCWSFRCSSTFDRKYNFYFSVLKCIWPNAHTRLNAQLSTILLPISLSWQVCVVEAARFERQHRHSLLKQLPWPVSIRVLILESLNTVFAVQLVIQICQLLKWKTINVVRDRSVYLHTITLVKAACLHCCCNFDSAPPLSDFAARISLMLTCWHISFNYLIKQLSRSSFKLRNSKLLLLWINDCLTCNAARQFVRRSCCISSILWCNVIWFL